MKNLKITLATLVAMVVLPVSTVFAYNGVDVDLRYEITMPAALSNGQGTVSSSNAGNFKYQFVETTAAKYSTLKKLEAQLELMKAFEAGEFADWTSAEANANYEAIVNRYESTYNEKVASLYTQYGSFDANTISDVRSIWIHELPSYVEGNWVSSSDRKVSLDTTTFTGTKYYVAWVQIGDMYDAEAYVVQGTKTTEPANTTDPEDNKPSDNTTNPTDNNKDNKDNSNTSTDKSGNTTTIPSTTNTTTKDYNTGSKTTSTASTLPKTGAADSMVILGGIALSTIGGAISYRKYRKIK